MELTVTSSVTYQALNQVKASGGRLFNLFGYNSGPDQWVQVHNAAATPSDGAVPVVTVWAQGSRNFYADLPPPGIPMASGIFVGNSTSGNLYVQGAADCFFTVISV